MENEQFLAIEISVLVGILVMCMLIYTLRQNTLILKQLRDQDSDDDISSTDHFNGDQAEHWFEKGDLKTLDKYCEGFIKQSPNSVHANWFCALSRYSQGDYELARGYFETVIRINPLWRDGASVYLQEISEKIGMPNSRTLH